METLDIPTWDPFGLLGIHHSFLQLNRDSIINTWIVLMVLLIFICICRFFMYKKDSIVQFLLTNSISSFMDLTTQTLGAFYYKHTAFIITLFIFIATCNWISIIPYVEEPTSDLNTTLALSIIAFFYKDFQTIKIHGIKAYLQEFLHPIFLMFPLNFIGHFSKIISMSFRLYGNIFGGAFISKIYTHAIAGTLWWELIGLFSGINFLIIGFFILFEGFIQAFVFAMLTLTYLAIALQASQEGELD